MSIFNKESTLWRWFVKHSEELGKAGSESDVLKELTDHRDEPYKNRDEPYKNEPYKTIKDKRKVTKAK